jgi:phosphoribosylformylglycinamidine cyclo-ligase
MTYRDAGVDIDAGNEVVERIKPAIRRTLRPEVLGGGIGGFGGLFDLSGKYKEPVMVSGTDGVGTKLILAKQLNRHDTIGIDLVAMCVNDVLVQGAEPLFFLDYFATGKLDVTTTVDVVGGIAKGCEIAGCALIGGETAEMPGMYQDGEYDAAGFIVGEVRESEIVDGRAVAVDDVLIGLPSGGLQTNGYSLARTILGLTGDGDHDRSVLAQPLIADDRITVGQALMAPHRSFAPKVLPLARAGVVTGMAHITGGGLIDNVPRMLPTGLSVEIDPDRWEVPPVFTQLVQMGDVRRSEYHRVLNMGIGFVLATRASDAESVLATLPKSVVIGRVIPTDSDGTRVLGLD